MIIKTCKYILLRSILHEQDFPLEVVWGNTVFEVFSVIMTLQNNLVNPKFQTGVKNPLDITAHYYIVSDSLENNIW